MWSPLTRQFIPSLLADASVSEKMWALDVACGPGYVSAAAKPVGAVPTGIDFSEKMVAIAKRMFPEFHSSKATRTACHLKTAVSIVCL